MKFHLEKIRGKSPNDFGVFGTSMNPSSNERKNDKMKTPLKTSTMKKPWDF